VWASVYRAGYGQHDADWLSFYDYFSEVCGLSAQTAKLEGLQTLARSAGWYWPHEHICWVCERQSGVYLDDQGRIHNETGLAVAFPDGWGVYAIHGVRVPEYVIMRPEEITVADIQGERNTEIRRIKLDRYGADRYLVDSGAKEIHRDDWGILYRSEIPDDEPLVMVNVVNSTPEGHYEETGEFEEYVDPIYRDLTPEEEAYADEYGCGRSIADLVGTRIAKRPVLRFIPDLDEHGEPIYHDFYIRVPPNCTTALEAVAWTFDKTPEQYRELAAQT
jgi:hypothetical protein